MSAPIPAFVSLASRSLDDAREAIADDPRFTPRLVEPARMAESVRAAIAAGARRVLVAGGDGTLASVGAEVARAGAEMAILPGGTMNHFAKRMGIPMDTKESLELAASGIAAPADAAWANDRLLLNTSSIGAYTSFVRTRERWERRVGYWIASLIAAVRSFGRLHPIRVEVEIDGRTVRYETPLLFIGVGERETRLPRLGGPVDGGRRGLHVLVVRGRTRARILALAFAAAARGLRSVTATPDLDAFLVERCRIEIGDGVRWVAFDGEIVEARSSIEYRFAPGAVNVVGHSMPSERALASSG